MHTTTLTLTPRRPFSFDRTLDFMCAFSPMAGEQELGGRRLVKALDVDGAVALVDVAASGDALSLAIDTEAPLSTEARPAVADRVRFMLSLDDDLAPFYARAAADAPLAPIVRALHGLHQPKFPSPFEIAVWAVLVQRVRIPIALRVKRSLTARFGARVGDEAAFPCAARLLAVPSSDLAFVVGSPVKAAAIRAIADALLAVDPAWLREGPYDEVERFLLDLPRIGPWSSSFILYRGLGRMERVDFAEHRELAACARAVYGAGADLHAIARSYGADLGAWAFYLRAGAAVRRAAA
ncbi:MAG TPA: hypothetical protein VGM56_09580 [Byssovorax sp.]|jgi:DNA-3-methyladenine glycosylase II